MHYLHYFNIKLLRQFFLNKTETEYFTVYFFMRHFLTFIFWQKIKVLDVLSGYFFRILRSTLSDVITTFLELISSAKDVVKG